MRTGICVCLSLALLGTVLSCGKAQASSEGYVPKVKVAAAAEKILAEEVSGFGALSFFTKVDVTALQDGTVRRLYRREGDSVAKGARIADLENVQLELAAARAENSLTQAQAALRLARSRLLEGEFSAEAELLGIARAGAELVQAAKVLEEQRRKQEDQETLYTEGGLSGEAVREGRFALSGAEEQFRLMERDLEIRTVGLRDRDLAAAGLLPAEGFASENERQAALIGLAVSTLRSELEAAGAQLEAAEKELESVRIARSELTVYSPAAGTVGARYFEEGERIKKEDKLVTLMDTGSLYVLFSLRESDALRLRKGMTARVGVGEAVYEGSVDLVSPQADSQSFTFTVRVLLPPSVTGAAENKLKPGMFARVTVHLGEERKALTVPESAVINRQDDEGTVFAVTQGRVSERKVRFGPSAADGEREVLSGLAPGEVVVLKPEAYLKEGSRVIPE